MDLIEEARNYALSEIKKYGTPSLLHFEISEKKALELAVQLKADITIVHIGACFMDLKLGQAIKENRQTEHCTMGVTATSTFLDDHGVKGRNKEKILNCITAHHRDVPFTCIEAEICANADCYRFIHPKGFFIYLTMLGNRGLSFAECLNSAEAKLEEKKKILSLTICKKELEGYYNTLHQFIADARGL